MNLEQLEISMELSSEVPGTNLDWPSDITVWINGVDIGTWTSPGDFGDVRGKFTPEWWKLAGSQYGLLKNWRVTESGTFIDGTEVSAVTLADLNLREHSSVKVRVGMKDGAPNYFPIIPKSVYFWFDDWGGQRLIHNHWLKFLNMCSNK